MWAVGCILYELLLRQKAFREDWIVVQYANSGKDYDAIIGPEVVPDEIKRGFLLKILKELLAIEPTRRPKANDLYERLISWRPRSPLSSKFVIAIEFGTTYTGVGWGVFTGSTGLEGHLSDARTLIEKIFINKKWPGQQSFFSEKTPTVISYATNPPTWGYAVRSQHKLQVSRFNLGLEDPKRVRDVYGLESGNLVQGLVPALNKSAVDVSADFLTQVNLYINTVALPRAFGEHFLAAQRISYVMTVPAIWSDRAKDLTRRAASRAGIPQDELILVTELEATALLCATTGDQLDLEVDDCFIICDAGEGTVVCKPLPLC
jgi:molecular chaperone DnaK (HSP70)